MHSQTNNKDLTMALKEFEIAVDGIGFFDTYTIKAKDLASAKNKAKAKALADFKKDLKAYKA